MIGLAILAAVTFSPAKLEPPVTRVSPRVTDAVAGLSVRGRKLSQALWVDWKKKVYAVKRLDCDGSHVWVYLGRDKTRLDDFPRFADNRSIVTSTKHGIELGTSSQSLQQMLGKPNKRVPKGQIETWSYFEKVDRKPGRFAYLFNDYSIKHGKVVAIGVGYEQVPGCGDFIF